jgi:hypothetical protein
MARPSSISRLPPEIRETIGRLREHGRTLDEILDHLRTLEIGVSRSALGRHVKGMEAMGERLRRSRAMAEGLARQLGDTPGDKMARVNIELLHSFLNDALAAADDDETEDGQEAAALVRSPKGAALFATAIERLTKAARANAAFTEQLEKRAAERAAKNAVEAVERAGRAAGLDPATLTRIRQEVYGLVQTPEGA